MALCSKKIVAYNPHLTLAPKYAEIYTVSDIPNCEVRSLVILFKSYFKCRNLERE
jgi:hypothetical protein